MSSDIDNIIPDVVSSVMSNMIYIPKAGISQSGLNKIKRLAAFTNPDFYKSQAMRLSTHGKPRVIGLSQEDNDYIMIPRGCIDSLEELLVRHNSTIRIEDKSFLGKTINVTFNGVLRDNQQEAVEALIKHNNGILAATTAFGKTVTAAGIIAKMKTNTLILVHTQALLEQWKKSLSEFLIINENLPEQLVKRGKKANRTIIGQIGGGKNTLNGIIDIALIQSLYHNNEVNPVINNYGMIFVDECHHISAVSFEAVLREAHARYIYGLTATPKRSDGQQPIIFMQCGKIRYTANASDYAKKHSFNHILIPRFTKFRMPITNEKYTITDVYKSITESEYRNKLIAADIIASVKSGRSPIVISERMSHLNLLYDLLKNCADNVIILSGKGTSKEKRCQLETLKSIPLSESIIILATGKYVGEGFDEPRLDTLFLSMPISWSGTLTQYAGRLHREYEGKESVIIYDYADLHIPMLENMYKKRLKGYSQLGYSLNSNNCTDYQTIYSDNSFEKDMYHDITNSQSSVVITGRYFSSYHISMLLKSFENAKLNGSVIHVAVKKSDNTYIDKLLQLLNFHGINYSVKNKLTSSFVIIDNKTVWYGSGELFTNFNDECVLRIEDEVLSSELYESVLK